MKLILHFIFTCITCSFFARKLFISFGIIIIDSAIPSNLYFESMSVTPEFCKSSSMLSVVHNDNIIFQSMIWLIVSIEN